MGCSHPGDRHRFFCLPTLDILYIIYPIMKRTPASFLNPLGFLLSVSLLCPCTARPATASTAAFSDSFVTTGPGGALSANNYGSAGGPGPGPPRTATSAST